MEFGPMHFLVVGIIALIFFGPSRLPTLGRSLGEAIRGFKKAMDSDGSTPAQSEADQLRRELELERARTQALREGVSPGQTQTAEQKAKDPASRS